MDEHQWTTARIAELEERMATPGTMEYAAAQLADVAMATFDEQQARHAYTLDRVRRERLVDAKPIADALLFYAELEERMRLIHRLTIRALREELVKEERNERYAFLLATGAWVRSAESVGWFNAAMHARFICYVPQTALPRSYSLEHETGFWGATPEAAIDAARAAVGTYQGTQG